MVAKTNSTFALLENNAYLVRTWNFSIGKHGLSLFISFFSSFPLFIIRERASKCPLF